MSYESRSLSNKTQEADKMIAINVEYNVKSGSQDELQKRLDETCRKFMAEDGCTRMEVFAPDGTENTLVLNELWRDAASPVVHREQAPSRRRDRRSVHQQTRPARDVGLRRDWLPPPTPLYFEVLDS